MSAIATREDYETEAAFLLYQGILHDEERSLLPQLPTAGLMLARVVEKLAETATCFAEAQEDQSGPTIAGSFGAIAVRAISAIPVVVDPTAAPGRAKDELVGSLDAALSDCGGEGACSVGTTPEWRLALVTASLAGAAAAVPELDHDLGDGVARAEAAERFSESLFSAAALAAAAMMYFDARGAHGDRLGGESPGRRP
ncbi:MAG: hypothetical protein H0V29_00815 [Thermoleophilaceae bacterium]|nr:hypothetical protein [Thermoleophilaceae bacterium]